MWTKKDIEIAIELNESGKRFSYIAKTLNRSYSSIRSKLNKLGYYENRIVKIRKCLNCNIQLKKQKTFCSLKCGGEYKRNEIFKKIEKGDMTLSTRNYKNYLIYKYGEKCMKCDWNKVHEITKKVPIQLNHIDGNSDNNKISNLELLCPNCHSLTPNFGALNDGNGRFKRKERRERQKKEKGFYV